LIDTGCKNIAMFSTIKQLSVSNLRAQGFYKAFEQKGLKVNENLIILTDNIEEFDAKINAFFDENKVDGVFALDEHTAVTAMKIGLRNGVKIPEELSIIGFADGVWSRRMTPSLSTVSQHGPEIGEVATKLLIEKLENKDENYNYKTTVIKTELRQRDSTKKL
jgi:LacI family transcriptional regulator